MKSTKTANKEVTILYRVAFKADSKKVCYICLSSDGTAQYTTCLYNGRRCSCTCPARTLHCKHAIAAEAREAERAPRTPAPRLQESWDEPSNTSEVKSLPSTFGTPAFSLIR